VPLKVEPLEEPYLNMTPLVDVILNLLIFFMLGTRFAEEERQIDIQLPTVSHAQPLTTPPDDIVINVFPDGHLVVNQQTLSAAQLQKLLTEAHARYAGQSVLIRGDGKGTYQSIMDVLSICQRARIHNYSLATQIASAPLNSDPVHSNPAKSNPLKTE
jgi:biopolymer transport protein ExbD